MRSRGSEGHLPSLLDPERLEQIVDELLALLRVHHREILEPPLHGGQLLSMGNLEEFPLRLSSLEGCQESSVFLRHPADKLLDQVFARLKQMVEFNGILSHPFEAPLEFLPDILARRREHFGHWAVVADHVDDEGVAKIVIDALIREQVADVEQVPWVLAVQRCNQLAGVEVGEADDLD